MRAPHPRTTNASRTHATDAIAPRRLSRPTVQQSPAGEVHVIPSALRDALAPCTRWVREGRTYGIACDGAEWLSVGRERLCPVWPGRFSWTARNAVGHARVRGGALSTPDSPPLDFEVVARRFQGPEEQLRFVRATVAALEREQSVDPFRDRHLEWRVAHGGATNSHRTLLDALILRGHELTEALAAVRARPTRVLAEHDAPLTLAVDAADVTLADILRGDGPWDLRTPGLAPGAARRLRGRVPREAWGRQAAPTDDGPENQLLRRSLGEVMERAASPAFVAALEAIPSRERSRARATLENLRRALGCAPLRDAVGPRFDRPRARARCLRHPHYAAVLAWIDGAEASPTLRWPAAREAASLRDASALYEMFCFFALARGFAAALGEPVTFHGPDPSDRAGARERGGLVRGAIARLGARRSLVYNAEVMAYSGALRPDFVLFEDGALSLVLDAKMRVRDPSSDRDPSDGDRAARVDIDRMHAYRDALGVRAAVCVFPGDRSALYRPDGTRSDELRIAGLARGRVDGVGALALVPEDAP